MQKRPGYWKRYHAANRHKIKGVFKFICSVVDKLHEPWKKSKRGRPYRTQPREYVSLCVLMKYCNMSYRDIEGLSSLVLRDIDHSSIGWAMQKISTVYIEKIVKLIHMVIDKLCCKGVYIVDSTGIVTDRYEDIRKVLKNERHKQWLKWHIFVKSYAEQGLISITSAMQTDSRTHDSPVFREIFDPKLHNNGMLFCDSAYDAKANILLALKNKLRPIIKPRKGVKRRTKRLKRLFDEQLYKQHRGAVECVFGGTETKYSNRTRCRLSHTRQIDVLMLAVVHNVKTYMRAKVIGKISLLVIY